MRNPKSQTRPLGTKRLRTRLRSKKQNRKAAAVRTPPVVGSTRYSAWKELWKGMGRQSNSSAAWEKCPGRGVSGELGWEIVNGQSQRLTLRDCPRRTKATTAQTLSLSRRQ